MSMSTYVPDFECNVCGSDACCSAAILQPRGGSQENDKDVNLKQ